MYVHWLFIPSWAHTGLQGAESLLVARDSVKLVIRCFNTMLDSQNFDTSNHLGVEAGYIVRV